LPSAPRLPISCSADFVTAMVEPARHRWATTDAWPDDREPVAAIEDLSKRYGRRTAVAGITLTVRAGEICGFVGANGGGKTTTLRMLAGILGPDGGRERVLGFDLVRDSAKIRERVGYMSQRLSLYAELSVFENLRFRADVYGLRRPRRAAEAAIGEFGLAPWARNPAGSLSGGWARRLQLAASLVHSPRLVLLDEPTAGLDAVARHEVWRRVERLAAAGAGVIVCTHDLAEAERCSRVAVFVDGQVVAAGVPEEIAARSSATVFLLSGVDARRLARMTRLRSQAWSPAIPKAGVCVSSPIRSGKSTCAGSPCRAGRASPGRPHGLRMPFSRGRRRCVSIGRDPARPKGDRWTTPCPNDGRRPY
jgi:ABC-2 type transport system ATP-binding protein